MKNLLSALKTLLPYRLVEGLSCFLGKCMETIVVGGEHITGTKAVIWAGREMDTAFKQPVVLVSFD